MLTLKLPYLSLALTSTYSFPKHGLLSLRSFDSQCSTTTHLNFQQPNQCHLLSILLKHPTRRISIQIHSLLITTGFHHCDLTNKTDLLIFNTLLRVYSQDLYPEEAFKLYKQALQISTFSAIINTFTLSFMLKACANLNQLFKGVQLHGVTVKFGFEFHVYVQTALVNMYSHCGFLDEGMKVFAEMPERNSVSWNTMITGLTKRGKMDLAQLYFDRMHDRDTVSWTLMIDGYTRVNQFREALQLFCQMMIVDGLKPTDITILAILPAVYSIGNVNICRSVHAYGEKTGFNASDIRVANSLIDAYSKCGCIQSAFNFFEEISTKRRNLVTWTSIISAFAMHGMAKEALEQFNGMERENLKANQITFLSLLTACSHGGLVKDGVVFFMKMVDEYMIMPNVKHYGCMIDMLGRAGMLEEAEKKAMEIPLDMVNVFIWRILLGACSFHGNAEMGERVMKKILEMERGYAGDYVLLSNIFTGIGRFGDAQKIRTSMDERNALKSPGQSLVDGRTAGSTLPM